MITKYECSTSSTKISISTQNNYKESYTDQHHTSVVDGIRQSINKKLFQELFWDFFSSSMSIWIPRNQQGRKPSIISWIILGSLHRHCLSKFPEIKKYKKASIISWIILRSAHFQCRSESSEINKHENHRLITNNPNSLQI